MTRAALALFVLLFLSVCGLAQAKGKQAGGYTCLMTEATFPAVRGVRLGMSTDQILDLFPGSRQRREVRESIARLKEAGEGEVTYVSFSPAVDTKGESFTGVDTVLVGFNRSRVVDFTVIYVGQTWRSIDEWIDKLAESLKLPASRAWLAGPVETPNKTLKCGGVEIHAETQGGGASIRVRNSESARVGGTNSERIEERKRREFKP